MGTLYLTDGDDLTSVANAIRAKSGGSSQLAFPAGFVSEIQSIVTGGGANETLLASGTLTLTANKEELTIPTGVASTANVTKAFVLCNLTTSPDSYGFMKYNSVVYVDEPQTMTGETGKNFVKCRYRNADGTGGGTFFYQNNAGSYVGCLVNANKEIVCRRFSGAYNFRPGTYSWYIWGEAAT